MEKHKVVSREAWLAARRKHLAREKELTRRRDRLGEERRRLPWARVDGDYVFDGPRGRESLADLFDGRSQLIVYHFMFGPRWKEGCPICSFWADCFDPLAIHLAHRDISLVAVSRAPLKKLEAYRKRMGWSFKWVSSSGNDFNFDYGVSFRPGEPRAYNFGTTEFGAEEAPGVSVFYRNREGEIFHTYSAYARGLDMLNGAYHFMDIAPKGRDEDTLPFPMAWVRRHDQYG